jgi:hypothetical protein
MGYYNYWEVCLLQSLVVSRELCAIVTLTLLGGWPATESCIVRELCASVTLKLFGR